MSRFQVNDDLTVRHSFMSTYQGFVKLESLIHNVGNVATEMEISNQLLAHTQCEGRWVMMKSQPTVRLRALGVSNVFDYIGENLYF